MSDFAFNNMSAINRRQFINAADTSLQKLMPKAEVARNGKITCRIMTEGGSKLLHSGFDPEAEARKLTDACSYISGNLIFCFGLGYGYHIRALRQKAGDDCFIAVIEPSYEIFASSVENCDMTDIVNDKNIEIFVSESFETVTSTKHSSFTPKNIKTASVFAMPIYIEAFQEVYKLFLEGFRSMSFSALVDTNTTSKYKYEWNKTYFENLRFLSQSISFTEFKDAFAGLPCIVVGAGPSLNKNVQALAKAKGKILIVCVYTAYNVLKKAGIEPDFVVSCDANQLVHEANEKDIARDFNLIYFSITQTEFLRRHTGKKIFVLANVFPLAVSMFNRLDLKTDTLTGGGSVAHLALDFARYSGASPIIFVGQDLSFEIDDNNLVNSHAEGTFYDKLKKGSFVREQYVRLDGVNGNDVYATLSFYTFLAWIEKYISIYKNEYIDATEGGAVIKGTTIMPLAEVLDKYCPDSAAISEISESKLLAETIINSDNIDKLMQMLNQSYEALQELEETLEDACKKCAGIIEIYENNQCLEEQERLYRLLDGLNNCDDRIDEFKTSVSMLEFIVAAAVEEAQSFDEAQPDCEYKKDMIIMKKNEYAYTQMLEAIRLTKPMILEAIQAATL